MLETAPPTISPERGEYLTGTMVAVAARLVGQMLDEVSQPSTDSPSSAGDRLMMMALKPWIPKLRAVLLAKLSEADPTSVERLMGATATALESILAQAPGAPLPRYRIDWDDDQTLILVPIEL